MNWYLFFVVVAVGSLYQLITMSGTTGRDKWGAVVQVLSNGLLVGLIFPQDVPMFTSIALAAVAPYFGGVAGKFVVNTINHFMGRRYYKRVTGDKWQAIQSYRAIRPDN